MDVTATILHLMGGSEVDRLGDERLHGASLLALARGGREWSRSVHYAEYHGDWYGHYSSRMVTDGRWKLVWNFSDLCELYDLSEDPGELRNRFDDPACAAARGRCFDLLYDEARRTDDRQAMMLAPAVDAAVR
jgi:arylsulfatase A-like enzyme